MPEYAIFAMVTPETRHASYVKPFVLYRVKRLALSPIEDGHHGFVLTADDGNELMCLWEGCAHLRGDNWRRVEVPLAEVPPDQREGVTIWKE